MKKKLLVVLTSMFTLASVATVVAVSSNHEFNQGVQGDVTNGSITWSRSASTKSGSSNNLFWTSQTESGTNIVLYSFGQYTPGNTVIFDSKYSEANNYGVFVKVEAQKTSDMFEFQNITSVTVVTTGSYTQSGANYAIFTDSTASGSPVANHTIESAGGDTHTFTTEVAGAHYFAIKPTNNYEFVIQSLTINYSCSNSTEKTLNELVLSGGKNTFVVGETFVFTGTGTAHYTNGDYSDVTSSLVIGSVDMSTTGNKVVDISYTEDDVTVHADFAITVEAATPKNITVRVFDVDYPDEDIAEYFVDYANSTIPASSVPGETVNMVVIISYFEIQSISATDWSGTLISNISFDGYSFSYTAPSTSYTNYRIDIMVSYVG